MDPATFLTKAVSAATEAGLPHPEYNACAAALESGWGESRLAREANNLFGQKRGFTTGGCQCIELPTQEFLQGNWVTVPARWPKFDSWADCFRARLALLKAMSCYAPALVAPTGEEFIRQVGKYWATDPNYAAKCLAIYAKHKDELVSR